MKICEAKIKGNWEKAKFYGVFQYSDVVTPSLMVGGHSGGVVAYPVVVVEFNKKLFSRTFDDVKNIQEVE